MNKTININLGGYFFHIDENAYQKLKRYLDAIAKSLSDDPQGKNEIISDIETRISELLSEKITDSRQVVNEQDINDIIKIMGEPEAYSEADADFSEANQTSYRRTSSNKKLYRDRDGKFIGGVASGLGYYLGVDVVWIRLAFILTTIFSGIGLLAYIIFWIITPEATTTTEKLQMEGEAVNIDNIEKKIREEFSSMKDTIKEGANEVSKKVNDGIKKNGRKAQSGFQDFIDVIGKIIVAFFKMIGKFIGFILVLVSAIVIISFIIAAFSIGSFEFMGLHDIHTLPFFYESSVPHWILGICVLILVGFPFLLLFVLGLRILSSNVRQFNKTTSLTLIGIWIVALLVVISSAIEFGTSNARSGNFIEKKSIDLKLKDTLTITMANNNDLYYQENIRSRDNHEEVYINDKTTIYSNYVKLDVQESKTGNAYLEIRKRSSGRNITKAQKNASEIKYNYIFTDNALTLDSYFLSDLNNYAKDEAVFVTFFLPEGNTIFFDSSTSSFLYHVYNTDNIYDEDMVNHYFLMTQKGLDCSDCENDLDKNDTL